MQNEPTKTPGIGWYVETPEGASGPWKTKAAAEAAGEGDFKQAQLIHSRAVMRDNVYRGKKR